MVLRCNLGRIEIRYPENLALEISVVAAGVLQISCLRPSSQTVLFRSLGIPLAKCRIRTTGKCRDETRQDNFHCWAKHFIRSDSLVCWTTLSRVESSRDVPREEAGREGERERERSSISRLSCHQNRRLSKRRFSDTNPVTCCIRGCSSPRPRPPPPASHKQSTSYSSYSELPHSAHNR